MIVEKDGLRWAVAGGCDHFGPSEHESGEVRDAILGMIPEGGVFLDVGAHVGYYTLRAVALAKAGHVYAVEANPDTAQRLRDNLQLNFIENVTVWNVAAWDSNTWLQPLPDVAELGGKTHCAGVRDGSQRYAPVANPDRPAVAAVPLDGMLKSLTRLDAVKLDVEGADLHALRGMRETIRRLRPRMIVEDHSVYGYYEQDGLFGLFGDLGYPSWAQLSYGGASYWLLEPSSASTGPMCSAITRPMS